MALDRTVLREALAEQDLTEQVEYLAARSPAAALRYIDAIEHALVRISEFPEIGGIWNSTHPKLSGIRVWPVQGFENYLIFYRVTETSVHVLRVLHGSRDIENIFTSSS